jgi:serine/threonine protein kinase
MAVRIEAQTEPIPGYKLLDRLGAGGFGEVWKAEAPGGIFKAIKIIHGDMRSQDADLVRYAEQELKALKRVKQVRHPYLLALDRYDIIEGRLMIVMELADCNLWDRFRACRERGMPGIPREELLLYMLEIAEVLDLFNDQFQLQHLDIKPQNLFLLYNHVKVADFGQVKDLQGFMAQVTGGITPVYAAPETFDGVITRYCDQYSLACVYQELLTGVRPFDGSSMSQLLMQHLNLAPNLTPSPSSDRPALHRALAKKPEDRWPNVTSFVRGLLGLTSTASGRILVPPQRSTPESPSQPGAGSGLVAPAAPRASSVSLPPLVLPNDTPPPRAVTETLTPEFTPAPPESFGPGSLRPALVVGIGQAGLRVLQRLRFDLTERYGPPEMTPLVRTLYVDTDPDALDEAARHRPLDGLAGLSPDHIYPAKLNRAAHYMKPRFNGRTLTEGWFDAQLLYKLPRTSHTMGWRLFGRLAFCDHYRPLLGKIQAELTTALASDSLALTETRTGMQRRTNRPQVYIVASLAGGTGGGMFIDMAYATRAKLKRMGYDDPEVIGVLVLPPADPSLAPPQALGNTYAALMELNHYCRSDTAFVANYDDRLGTIKDKAPPFARCYLVPGSALGLNPAPQGVGTPTRARTPSNIPAPPNRARPGSGSVVKPGSRVVAAAAAQRPDPTAMLAALKPYSDAADLIRLNLFSPLGRIVDEARTQLEADTPAQPAITLAAFGLLGFSWPRTEVIARTAAKVTRSILRRWAAPDLKRSREVMPQLAQQKWTQLGLDPDIVLGHFQQAAEFAVGGKIDELIALTTDPLVPRGWLARLPEPAQVAVALDRLTKLLGPPASSVKRPPTALEQTLAQTATDNGAAFALDIRTLAPALIDDPQFRLSGTEEMLRQFLATTDRLMEKYRNTAGDLEAKSQSAFECVSRYAHFQPGMRKPSGSEFGEALRLFPRARFQAMTFRSLIALYQAVRDALSAQLADVSLARQRLDASPSIPSLTAAPPEPPPGARRLMPGGCATIAEATERFLAVITEADLVEIDRRVQGVLEPSLGGVFQACLNSTLGSEGVVSAVYEEARAHLDVRLGSVDLASMFAERYRTTQQAERAIEQTYQEAEPSWAGSGPWAAAEVSVVGCPSGAGGDPLRELARRAIPVAGLPLAETPDELLVYREWSEIPLASLPHLGPPGAAAYQALPDTQQCPAHARLDVTRWAKVDEP